MIIKILSTQIPVFWENIKFCATQADEINSEDLPVYLNDLLHSLLSDKSQCFIRLDENRVLIALMITRIESNKINGAKSLQIRCLYSFKHVSGNQWGAEFEFIRKFAEKEDCKSITFDTRIEKIAQLGQLIGFKEVHKSFELKLRGV